MVKTKTFTIGHFNAGSLGTGHDEFIAVMERYGADIVSINETWLSVGEDQRAPVVSGYRLRHAPRLRVPGQRQRGGGVGFYIRDGVNVRVRSHPVAANIEQMWLTCTVNSVKLLVGTAYRPPWQNLNSFLDAITDTITSLAGYDKIILLGDFNVDIQNHDSYTQTFNEFVSSLSLNQLVTEPTHFANDDSETLIDVVCTDIETRRTTVDYIPPLGRHAFICVELNLKKAKPKPRWIVYRPLQDIDITQFGSDLNSINWEDIKTLDNLNRMVDTFNDSVVRLFDLHAPEKRVLIKNNSHPWITDTVKDMMELRDAAHRKSRITKSDTQKQSYLDLKRLVNCAIYNEKRAYFEHNINKNIKNSATLWKNLKNTALRSHTELGLPNHLQNPDKMNQHFLDLTGNSSVSETDVNFYESHKLGTSHFNLLTIHEEAVTKIINDLKSNARGADNIALNMIVLTLPRTLEIITFLINVSIKTSTFPDLWKIGIVRPIPKKENPASENELRPITLLTCLSKILEKAVNNQLTQYLEINKILPMVQSGFRKGRSTATALLSVVDDILASQDKGMGTLLTLLDFSRAFDTINVSLLLAKLSYYGFEVSTINWFRSYLTNRSQKVVFTGTHGKTLSSSLLPVTRGVPQGSILGPILFILYSSDIIKCIKYCKYHIYADDLQLYLDCSPEDCVDTVNKINEDLERIVDWSNKNCLVLNPTKSKFMILGSKNQIQGIKDLNPDIKVNGTSVEEVTEARNLGVLFERNLRFEKHILNVVRSCFYKLKVLYKIRPYINEELRIQLCEALVLSRLNYADTVYGPCLYAKTQSLIQRVQNACARFCFNVPPRAHVTPFLNKSNLLKLSSRRKLHFATLLFSVVRNETPEYLFMKLTWSRQFNKHNTRASSYLLITPKHSTAAFRCSFRYASCKCWNNLPPPIRDLKKASTFKQRLKLHLITLQKLQP
ncbi:unnamed protein product [Plutella xylostella]|uniref:(diamondback moth) hypothetical protein n=1 Tax=Plutella xylostella TaxID=51655 RepID=A0A8S4G9J0_PLUXY|nr:unnamed protein product [Plutella xylostella]